METGRAWNGPPQRVNLVGSWEAHLPRLNTSTRPIVNQYREGKVKRTPVAGSERDPETVCLQAVKAPASGAMACLLHNEPASYRVLPG